MPEPGDEFERILRDVRSQLDNIRLDIPSLEGKGAAPRSPEWVAVSLDPPPPPRAVPVELPSYEAAPAFASAALSSPLQDQREDRPLPSADIRLPSADLKAEPDEPFGRPSPRVPEPPQPAPRRPALTVAASAVLLMSAAAGIWWNLPSAADQVLPVAALDAIAARGANEWIVARQRDLLLYDGSLSSRPLGKTPEPLTSIFWIEGALYGSDGKNTLYHWESLDAPPNTFALAHGPVAIFARPPHVWTLDKSGSLRQFLLSRSMTGIFLQPLDRTEAALSGDFSLGKDGHLILLERSSGSLVKLTLGDSSYSVSARGESYGAGARLITAGRKLLIARSDGEKTTLVPIPSAFH